MLYSAKAFALGKVGTEIEPTLHLPKCLGLLFLEKSVPFPNPLKKGPTSLAPLSTLPPEEVPFLIPTKDLWVSPMVSKLISQS